MITFCPDCFDDVSTDRWNCPHCGARIRSRIIWYKAKERIATAVGFLSLPLMLGSYILLMASFRDWWLPLIMVWGASIWLFSKLDRWTTGDPWELHLEMRRYHVDTLWEIEPETKVLARSFTIWWAVNRDSGGEEFKAEGLCILQGQDGLAINSYSGGNLPYSPKPGHVMWPHPLVIGSRSVLHVRLGSQVQLANKRILWFESLLDGPQPRSRRRFPWLRKLTWEQYCDEWLDPLGQWEERFKVIAEEDRKQHLLLNREDRLPPNG